jgi:hypothetical protein
MLGIAEMQYERDGGGSVDIALTSKSRLPYTQQS